MTISIKNQILVFALCILSFNTCANETFKQQKPDNLDNKSWSNLKSAIQESKLLPTPDGIGGSFNNFGQSVSVYGNYALVGAPNMSSHGLVYVYKLQQNSWIESEVLAPSDGEHGDRFGNSVSLYGNRALIGAPNGSNSGSAYIFDLNIDTWSQTQKLLPLDGERGDLFGYSVSLSNNIALIGARSDDTLVNYSGSAYIFEFSGTSWVQNQKLLASDTSAFDYFGTSVNISNDYLIVGAPESDTNGDNSGSAYIFHLSNGNWTQTQKLFANDGVAYDQFGTSVSIFGERVLIGSNNGSNVSAYIFDLIAGTWVESQKIQPDDSASNSYYRMALHRLGE